jgi:hypothetical protein
VKTPAGEVPVLEAVEVGQYHRDLADDPERCEYFVPVQWLQTVPIEKPISEAGLFGNQNTVCKPITPKWRSTVARLKELFPSFDLRRYSAMSLRNSRSDLLRDMSLFAGHF